MYVSEEEMELFSCVIMYDVYDVVLCCNTKKCGSLVSDWLATPTIARHIRPTSKSLMSNRSH